MEDLDPPREVLGAADDILRTLEGFGLHWDGEVMFQSRRHGAYREALDELCFGGQAYPCGCSRKDWLGQPHYPGTCRSGLAPGKAARMQRHRLSGRRREWTDVYRGHHAYETAQLGDFPLLRADGHWAYQLAVVVDDRMQGVTEVIRGADLLDSTPLQLDLWAALNEGRGVQPTPQYGHLPILQTLSGQKLSKQTLARPVDVAEAASLVDLVWGLLGQQGTVEWRSAIVGATPPEIMGLAVDLWDESVVPTEPVQLQGWGQDSPP